MRWPSLASWTLAAGLVVIGAVNLATNPSVVSRAHAQAPPNEGQPFEGNCDPSQAPCCVEENDPCCVNNSWTCNCS